MTAYDRIRAAACQWCAADRPLCDHVERMHWTDHMAATVDCTAPTSDEVIEQQAARIAELEQRVADEKKRADGNFVSCERIRKKLSDSANLVKARQRQIAELTADKERLEAVMSNKWCVYGLRRDDGHVNWYVRSFGCGVRLTEACDSGRQAIDAARKEKADA